MMNPARESLSSLHRPPFNAADMNAQALITGNGDASRTLIAVFLRGAADGLTLVAPIQDDHYYKARPRLGVAKKGAVKLDDIFAFNPKLAELASAFHDGELAIVHAAGTEDQTRSHFDAQDLMEHGGVVAGGWLGRFLRARPQAATGALTCVAVGKVLPESLSGAPTVTVMQSLDEFSLGAKAPGLRPGLERLYAMEHGQLGAAARDTFDALQRIDAMRNAPYQPAGGAEYGDDEFSVGMRQLARLIKAGVGLEAASIDIGGWDSHFTQETLMDPLMVRLNKGLHAFRRDMGSRMASTTVVVMTEFGRSVEENSSFGTDHGRGSTMFVLGGGVKGGRVHGIWKGLAPAGLEQRGLLESYGDLPVWNNYRNVLASVLTQHGATPVMMPQIFPDFAINPMKLYS
jgi:uncharacterized protein (DUF1501 family)